jgi:16S rRNA (cytidine1402-2'-O)-methyltransferase
MPWAGISTAVEGHVTQIMSYGTLYLIATPIGNLEDISARALRLLREVDLIACEDTRHTAKLLSHYGIATPRESYHEHNEGGRTPQLIEQLKNGRNIALVSDAGSPLLSDPGFPLVSACRQAGIAVTPIPGPSAAIAALTGSGLPSEGFFFVGFLPSRTALRRRRLEEISAIPATLVIYEAPHRLLGSLADMVQLLGNRKACLARELTKIHEEWVTGTLQEILDQMSLRGQIKGEMTLVVEKGEAALQPDDWPASLRQHLEQEMAETSSSHKEALKSIARKRGLSRKDAYRLLVTEKN